MQTKQLLDACFDLLPVNDDEMKQKLISDVLYQQSVPRALTLSSETITREAKRARRLANHALAYLYTPLVINDLASGSQKILFMSNYSLNVAFKVFDPDSELRKIAAVTMNQSRETLITCSSQMYNAAREIVLNPLVFEHLGKNKDLLRTVFCMSHYAVGRGNNMTEAQMFSSACRVFLKQEYKRLKCLDRGNLSSKDKLVEDEGIDLEKMTAISSGIIFIATTHEATYNGFYSEKVLKKTLRRAIKSLDVQFCPVDQLMYFQIKREGLKRLCKVVKGIANIEKLRSYIETSKYLRTSEPWITAEMRVTTFWNIQLYAFDIYALNIVLRKITDLSHLNEIKQMCYAISKEMVQYIHENIHLACHGGGRLMPQLNFVIYYLIQESDQVTCIEQLNACLQALNTAYGICNTLFEKHRSEIFLTLGKRAAERVNFLQDKISTLYSATIDNLMDKNPMDITDLEDFTNYFNEI